ncbi:MAG: RDD family protein [Solirubrobacteraceae bacterium]
MQRSDVLGRRIGAAIIDIGIVVVLVLLVGGIVGNDTVADAPDSARFGALDRVLIICLVFAYYWISETVWAQTLGKRALGIRVERVDGGKATAGATFVRTLLRAVDGLLFYLVGLITVLATGERRQRLGDLAAKTRVVAVNERPGEPPPASRPPPDDEDALAQIMR